MLLQLDIVAAATIRAHCLIAAEAAGPPLIQGPQAIALHVPPYGGHESNNSNSL